MHLVNNYGFKKHIFYLFVIFIQGLHQLQSSVLLVVPVYTHQSDIHYTDHTQLHKKTNSLSIKRLK